MEPVGRDVLPARLQRAPAASERVLADRVEDDVVRLAVLREVLSRVVDDDVGAERPHELDVLRVADRGDVRTDVSGELDGRRSDRARGAVDDEAASRPERPRRGCRTARTARRRRSAQPPRTSCPPACAQAGLRACRCTPPGRRTPPRGTPGCRRPGHRPRTRSTAAPTASTSPASSAPRIRSFGRRKPLKKRHRNGFAARTWQSVRLTVVAWILTRTSSSVGLRPLDLLDPQDLRGPVPVVDDRSHRAAHRVAADPLWLTVRTTLPVFCPVSTYAVASTTSSSG